MTSAFQRSMALLVDDERGYSDRPIKHDPGGATNWGITRAVLARWRGRRVSKDDVRALSLKEATRIYREWYWKKARCHLMPAGADYAVFDAMVQHSPKATGRIVQRACKRAGYSPGRIDGVIGRKTVAAVRAAMKADPHLWLEWYGTYREFYYRSLSNFPPNGHGWIRRLIGGCMDAWLMAHKAATRQTRGDP